MTVWENVLARLISLAERHDLMHTLLGTIDTKLEKIMSALTDLQAADASLKAEVATFLADIASALQGDDPDVEAVVADINQQVALLQGADPANAAATPPPADTAPTS